MRTTKIQWLMGGATWSPWRGCTKVSPGCANCYAEALSLRNPAVLGEWGPGRPRVLAKNWREPVLWNAEVAGRSCGHCEFDEADVPVFVKQLGYQPREWDGKGDALLPISDPKGGNPVEWPETLRVREWPRGWE